MARCGKCAHFASVNHGGGGGRPGGSSCAGPECDCQKFVDGSDVRLPLGKDNLTPAEVAQLTGLSVHTLSYWRQTDQGPKTVTAGTRTPYRRKDVEQWLADIDGRSEPVRSSRNGRSESTSTTTGWYKPEFTQGDRGGFGQECSVRDATPNVALLRPRRFSLVVL